MMCNSKIVREAVAYTYKGGNDLSIRYSVMEDEDETLAFAIAQSFRKRLGTESCCKGIIALNDNVRTVYFSNDANEEVATVQVINCMPDFKKLADRTLAEIVKGLELTFEGTLFDKLIERTNSELARLEISGKRAYAQTYNALDSMLFDVVFADNAKKEVGFALSPFEPTAYVKAQFNNLLLSFANYGVEFRDYEATGTSATVPIVVIKKMN